MTCKELQQLLYSARIENFDPAEREFLKKHLAECEACKTIFQEILKADQILDSIKKATPRIRNEQALKDSILAAIVNKKQVEKTNTFFERLSDVFSMQAVRFACCAVILFCGMMYLFMEYTDTKEIVSLEQRLSLQHNFSRASIALPGVDVPDFLYDFYELSNGSKAYIELTNKLILMKKEDLQALLNGYKTLDEASRKRLDALQNQFLKDGYMKFSSAEKDKELEMLRNEIERLKKELEQSNNKEKR
jgi:hypothetical protein